ncbi:alpha-actinin-4-like [Acropora palmata]|uniref:alpha-actinin-4-like n=1 Tax=Acropora palmata TaxID=6131 RepID=UPI003DA089AD
MASRPTSNSRSPSPENSLGMPRSSSVSTAQLMASLTEQQVFVQKRTFGRWMNYILRKRKPSIHIDDDQIEGLQDGTKFLALLEVLSGERLPSEKGNKRPHHLANIGAALKFLTAKNVKLVNIHRESVVDGNETVILGLIWAIIHRYQASY